MEPADPSAGYNKRFDDGATGMTINNSRIDTKLLDWVSRYEDRPDTAPQDPVGSNSNTDPASVRFAPVDIRYTGPLDAALADLERLGAREISTAPGLIGALVPNEQISQLENFDWLSLAILSQPVFKTGSVTSEGDEALGADIIREQFDATGAGVVVGIVSDSFDRLKDISATDLTAERDILSGDLPDDVIVIKEFDSAQASFRQPTDEGRAMAQIVHDLAPDATILFHTAGSTRASFAQALETLASAGADIIVEDVLFDRQAMFQDGPVAQTAARIAASGTPVISAAGNFGRDSYDAQFRDSGLGFDAIPTIDQASLRSQTRLTDLSHVLHDFDPDSDAIDVTQDFTLPADRQLILSFQWIQDLVSERAGADPANLDIFLFDAEGTLLDSGTIASSGLGIEDRIETINYTNETGESQSVFLTIGKLGDAANPERIKYIPLTFNGTFADDTDIEFWRDPNERIPAATIFGNPNAETVLAVGAGSIDDIPPGGTIPTEVADYSSVGAVPIFYDAQDERLASPIIRTKPEIVGPSDVENTFFGDVRFVDGTFRGVFSGTSAAAPHVAGLAALLTEIDPGLDAAELTAALIETALDEISPGAAAGNGFIDGPATAALVAEQRSVNSFTSIDPTTFAGRQSVLDALVAPGGGIEILDVEFTGFTGSDNRSGAISTFDAIDLGRIDNEDLTLGSGILLSTGSSTPADANENERFSVINGTPGDDDLTALAASVFDDADQTEDAARLAIDFRVTDTKVNGIAFDLLFGSDELPRQSGSSTGSQFVDVAAVFLNGRNIAFFDGNDGQPLSVLDANQEAGYFKSNAPFGFDADNSAPLAIEYNAVSSRLQIQGDLDPGTHRIEFAIADTQDDRVDSALLVSDMRLLFDAPTIGGSGGGIFKSITGNPAANTLIGTDLQEIIDGQFGDDDLFGGGGNDIILGGAGNDRINGGLGRDSLLGGPGEDFFSGDDDEFDDDTIEDPEDGDSVVFKDPGLGRRDFKFTGDNDLKIERLSTESVLTLKGGLNNSFLDFIQENGETRLRITPKSEIRPDTFDTDGNNNTPDTATLLEPVAGRLAIDRLTIGLGDEDWYRFETTQRGDRSHFASIDFFDIEGDLDFELYDGARNLVQTSYGIQDGEFLSFKGLDAGTYFLRAFSFEDEANPEYRLTLSVPRISVPNDDFEPNNSFANARDLDGEALPLEGLTISKDDVDYFSFTLLEAGGDDDQVRIDFDNDEGNLNLFLLGFDEEELAASDGNGDTEIVTLRALRPDTYFLRVEGANDDVENSDYTLTITGALPPVRDDNGRVFLNELAGTDGFVINGIDLGNETGVSVGGEGDINADGIADLVVGAYKANANGVLSAGQAYTVFGASNIGQSGSLNLGSLIAPVGLILNGEEDSDQTGRAVSILPDVNGDGIDDLLIGADEADSGGDDSGTAYVVFGDTALNTRNAIDLSSLDGTNGFVIQGREADFETGFAVSDAGDVNNDGFADLAVGAFRADQSGNSSGEAYILFGGFAMGASGAIDLDQLNGQNGVVIDGADIGDQAGFAVAALGDVNNDGVADIGIGAPRAQVGDIETGRAFVLFGAADFGTGGVIQLADLDGQRGFALDGGGAGHQTGVALDGVGDVNHDGIDDFAIGADFGGSSAEGGGRVYIVFGDAQIGMSGTVSLSTLDQDRGLQIDGASNDDRLGRAVSGAGDFNADGVDDLLIGAWGHDNEDQDTGEAYIVFGRSDFGAGGPLSVSALTAETGTTLLNSRAEGRAGFSVASTGDVNADGVDDVIIGSPGTPGGSASAGNAYVVFGVPGNTVSADRFEDNDSLTTATSLGIIDPIRTERNLTLEAGESDWFTFDLVRAGDSDDTLQLGFDDGYADLTLSLFLPSGQEIRGSLGGDATRTVSLDGLPAGRYFARIEAADGASANPRYHLQIDASPSLNSDQALANFGIQYQGRPGDDNFTVEALASAAHQALIIEASQVVAFEGNREVPFSAADIETISNAVPERSVYAYITVGEIEDYRDYWLDAVGSDVALTDDLSAFQLPWAGPRFTDSGGTDRRIAQYWTDEWKAIVTNRVTDIAARDFDGILIDNVLSYFNIRQNPTLDFSDISAPALPQTDQEAAREMMALVVDIAAEARRINPDFEIIVNGGPFIFGDAGDADQNDPLSQAYLDAIDFIAFESYLGNMLQGSFLDVIDTQFVDQGVAPLSIDFTNTSSNAVHVETLGIDSFRALIEAQAALRGIVPFTSTTLFNQLDEPSSAPFNTPTSGDDILIASPEGATLSASGGRDWLVGGRGGDVLDGGAGDDVLDGRAGPDTLIGGTGDDSFLVDTADPFILGGAGTDVARLDRFLSETQLTPFGDDLVAITLPSGQILHQLESTEYIQFNDGLIDTRIWTAVDRPTLTVSQPTVNEPQSGTSVMTFDITLNGAAKAHDIVLAYETFAGSAIAGEDYLSAAGLLRIEAGTTGAVLEVTVLSDAVSEGDEIVTVNFSDPIGAVFNGGATEVTQTGTISGAVGSNSAGSAFTSALFANSAISALAKMTDTATDEGISLVAHLQRDYLSTYEATTITDLGIIFDHVAAEIEATWI